MRGFGAVEAVGRGTVVGEGAGLAEVVPASRLDGGAEGARADAAGGGQARLVQVVFLLRMYFIVLFAIIDIMPHELQLLSLLLSLEFLVELPATFVVRTIMNENARIPEVAPP